MPRTPTLTRRTVLKTTGAALTTATGAAYVYTASQPATGLQVSGLAVESADRTLGPAEVVSAVRLTVDLSYQWQASHAPDEATVELFVSQPGGNLAVLDSQQLADPGTEGSGQTSLSGDLLETEAFSSSAFELSGGESATRDVAMKAVLTLWRDGARIGTADAETVATVDVAKESLTVSASVGGDGVLSVET